MRCGAAGRGGEGEGTKHCLTIPFLLKYFPVNIHLPTNLVASSAGDVLLLLHIVGQRLAADAGRVGNIFHLSFISNVLSLGRRLTMKELL